MYIKLGNKTIFKKFKKVFFQNKVSQNQNYNTFNKFL